MDIILLGITIVSLIVALAMSILAMRVSREEKQRAAARVAALSLASADDSPKGSVPVAVKTEVPKPLWSSPPAPRAQIAPVAPPKAPATAARAVAVEVPLNEPPFQPERVDAPEFGVTHATGFLGASAAERDNGGHQKQLALAAAVLFVVLSGGLVWMMSGPRGTTAQAMGPNSPLELMSLTHQRQSQKLAVSGLVRNPDAAKPIERLSAVVFLFDRTGTFVTSSRAHVDFLKLGAGDESPFVVTLDAPATVARYRVSFRTDEGVVPHVDRRSASPVPAAGEQTLNVSVK